MTLAAVLMMDARWANSASGVLVATLWQGTLLVAAVALALRLLPGLSAGVRGRLWLGVLAMLVLLPAMEMCLPLLHSSTTPSGAGHGVRITQAWSLALAGAWAVLAMVRLARLGVGVVRLRQMLREATPVTASAEVQELLGGVVLCVSDVVGRPSVVGWRRPRILLPPAMWAAMSREELRQVVLHEMEHVRRGDQWTNVLQKFAVALLPWSPAALWVERRLCLERELACDDGVLRVGGGRKAYASSLTRLAEFSMLQRGALLALGAWERQSELARRVTRLLRGPEAGMPAGRRRVAIAGVAGLVLLGGTELARVPRLVEFGPAPALQTAGVAPVHTGVLPVTGRASDVSAPFAERLAGAHMVLASAQMPNSAGARKTQQRLHSASADRSADRAGRRSSRGRVAVAGPAMRRVMERRWHDREHWVVLTSLRGGSALRAGVAEPTTVASGIHEIVPSYAAVPVAGGWLVFQL